MRASLLALRTLASLLVPSPARISCRTPEIQEEAALLLGAIGAYNIAAATVQRKGMWSCRSPRRGQLMRSCSFAPCADCKGRQGGGQEGGHAASLTTAGHSPQDPSRCATGCCSSGRCRCCSGARRCRPLACLPAPTPTAPAAAAWLPQEQSWLALQQALMAVAESLRLANAVDGAEALQQQYIPALMQVGGPAPLSPVQKQKGAQRGTADRRSPGPLLTPRARSLCPRPFSICSRTRARRPGCSLTS